MKKVFSLFTYIFVFPIVPLISFLALFFLWDNSTGVFVIETFIFCGCVLFNYFYFAYKTNQLHDMENDYFKLSINQLKKFNGIIEVKLEEGKGVIEIQDRKLEFNLGNYPFQKSYICAYFIRQLLYREMNERHKPLGYLFKSFYRPLCILQKKEIREIVINFHENDSTKKICIVKDYKPLNKGFKNLITEAPYYWLALQRHGGGRTLNRIIKRIDEVAYWDNASSKVRAMRYNNK